MSFIQILGMMVVLGGVAILATIKPAQQPRPELSEAE
jgi:hypothetical protein